MLAWLEWLDSWYTLQIFFQTSWGRVCTQHCASRATSTTGLSLSVCVCFSVCRVCRFQCGLVGPWCPYVWNVGRSISVRHCWTDRQPRPEHWRLFVPRLPSLLSVSVCLSVCLSLLLFVSLCCFLCFEKSVWKHLQSQCHQFHYLSDSVQQSAKVCSLLVLLFLNGFDLISFTRLLKD